jgi:hypothetical protein
MRRTTEAAATDISRSRLRLTAASAGARLGEPGQRAPRRRPPCRQSPSRRDRAPRNAADSPAPLAAAKATAHLPTFVSGRVLRRRPSRTAMCPDLPFTMPLNVPSPLPSIESATAFLARHGDREPAAPGTTPVAPPAPVPSVHTKDWSGRKDGRDVSAPAAACERLGRRPPTRLKRATSCAPLEPFTGGA